MPLETPGFMCYITANPEDLTTSCINSSCSGLLKFNVTTRCFSAIEISSFFAQAECNCEVTTELCTSSWATNIPECKVLKEDWQFIFSAIEVTCG